MRNSLKQLFFIGALSLTFAGISVQAEESEGSYPESCPEIYHHTMKQLHSSKMLNLCDVTDGKPVLLVNTASHCGFTDQFGDLEAIHEKYKDRGLVVLGVSSDSFNLECGNSNSSEPPYLPG